MTAMLNMRPLAPEDASLLAGLMQQQPPGYMQYFTPFAFEAPVIEAMLAGSSQDVYMGIFWDEALAGFFMLRGWDEGYAVPAYGVTIAESFRGQGLGRLSLEASKSISRLKGAERLMLKVHPNNRAAKHLYESVGFVETGYDARNGNLIYHFELAPTQSR